ncbi:thiamine-phosphate kinase [Xanthobacter sp. TB0139]|uniref:thiamine-phosphate kinase n=1 Tax=Xanthobacter sp. TB0139 TaxID=3459178 RepID=UPI004039783A
MQGGGSGEDSFIARFFRPQAGAPAALGLQDDAALLALPEGRELVLTKDALIAGVHFFPDDPPISIARKALRVNLSDLAAKGAEPLGALLAVAVPKEWAGQAVEGSAGNKAEVWVAAFAEALGADCRLHGCPLLGGDTVSTPGPLALSITALGSVPKGQFVPRTGAKAGQAIVVSGTIGDAALGLLLRQNPSLPAFAGLSDEQRRHLLDRYLHPQPRLALAPALRAHAVAAMDVSDGLAGDLAKMLSASGCGGRLEAGRVPLSSAAAAVVQAEPDLLRTVLGGGDDYEILATVSHDKLPQLISDAADIGIGLYMVGETHIAAGLDIQDRHGQPMELDSGSFSHF